MVVLVLICIFCALIMGYAYYSFRKQKRPLLVIDKIIATRVAPWGQNNFQFRNRGKKPIDGIILSFKKKPDTISWAPKNLSYSELDDNDGYSLIIHRINPSETIHFLSFGLGSSLRMVSNGERCITMHDEYHDFFNIFRGIKFLFGRASL